MLKRTEAIDAALAEIDREMHVVETKRRELLYATAAAGEGLAGLDELTELSAKMTALHQRRAGLADLRAQSAAHDQAELLKERQADILQHVSDAGAALARRVQLGAKVDAMIAKLGELLRQVQAANEEAANHITEAMRMTPAEQSTKLNLRMVIGDYMNGTFAGVALASKLRAQGIGETGIPMQVIWNYGTIGDDESVAEAMAYGKAKLETTFRFWLSSCLDNVPKPDPMPSRLPADAPKHWTQMSADDFEAAARAAQGPQRGAQVIDLDDPSFSDEDRRMIRGGLAVSGGGEVRIKDPNGDARIES